MFVWGLTREMIYNVINGEDNKQKPLPNQAEKQAEQPVGGA